MALSIGVQKGTTIYIGGVAGKVSALTPTNILFEFGGKEHGISHDCRTEISPNVFVSIGQDFCNQLHGPKFARLTFEAPRNIAIRRVETK